MVDSATYGLCAALGATLDGKEKFNFNLAATEEGSKGILGLPRAKEVWSMQIEKSDEYFDSLLVSTKIFNHGIVPGTNPNEGWHMYIQRYCCSPGRKSLPVAEGQVHLAKVMYNYAVKHTLHRGVATYSPRSKSKPVATTRVHKSRILREDNRLHVLKEYTNFVQGMGSWGRLMKAMDETQVDQETRQSLERKGYAIRFANTAKLTEREKVCSCSRSCSRSCSHSCFCSCFLFLFLFSIFGFYFCCFVSIF